MLIKPGMMFVASIPNFTTEGIPGMGFIGVIERKRNSIDDESWYIRASARRGLGMGSARFRPCRINETWLYANQMIVAYDY